MHMTKILIFLYCLHLLNLHYGLAWKVDNHSFPISRQPTLPAVPILQSYHMSNYIKISTGNLSTK
ncbi:hypothetical protein ACB094_03G127000 [Castanea mollissima]